MGIIYVIIVVMGIVILLLLCRLMVVGKIFFFKIMIKLFFLDGWVGHHRRLGGWVENCLAGAAEFLPLDFQKSKFYPPPSTYIVIVILLPL